MSFSQRGGCLAWGGSIFTAVIVSLLSGVAIIIGLVLITSLRVVWREKQVQTELSTALNSIPPLANGMARQQLSLPFVKICSTIFSIKTTGIEI